MPKHLHLPSFLPKSQPAADHPPVIIADRAEFIDALNRLRCGHVLVRPRNADSDHAVLDNAMLYTAFGPLARYGLVNEYANPLGFPTMSYYRLTESGRHFADRACKAWAQLPLLQRLAVRLLG